MSGINNKVLFLVLICTFSVFAAWDDPANYLCDPEGSNPTSLFKLTPGSVRPLDDDRVLLKASTENIYYSLIAASDSIEHYWKSKHLFYYINNGNQLQIVRYSKSKIL
jgi:hypothetical protein